MQRKRTERKGRREEPKMQTSESQNTSNWVPKTELGKKVKKGEITDINEIIENKYSVLEADMIDVLVPDLEKDLLMIGQSKGKFGGGQRRVFRQTQKKTREGNKPKFATLAVIGNRNGLVGIGYGKSKETVPAREKAFRNAKLNLIRIRKGCGSWECSCGTPHSIPFKVEGKCGSSKIILMPAPKGTGLCIEKECAKILALAGIKDVWSRSFGQTRTKLNLIKACFSAMKKLTSTKVQHKHMKSLSIEEGRVQNESQE
jgi:small subunit ribosomal protein S5